MILPGSLEKAWIQEISKTIGKRGDPKLVEKIIYSLTLLEQLKLTGLDLIFKGGTSLFLMSESIGYRIKEQNKSVSWLRE